MAVFTGGSIDAMMLLIISGLNPSPIMTFVPSNAEIDGEVSVLKSSGVRSNVPNTVQISFPLLGSTIANPKYAWIPPPSSAEPVLIEMSIVTFRNNKVNWPLNLKWNSVGAMWTSRNAPSNVGSVDTTEPSGAVSEFDAGGFTSGFSTVGIPSGSASSGVGTTQSNAPALIGVNSVMLQYFGSLNRIAGRYLPSRAVASACASYTPYARMVYVPGIKFTTVSIATLSPVCSLASTARIVSPRRRI
eukprot:30802-Pelagococcus_subviridis.AAC.28